MSDEGGFDEGLDGVLFVGVELVVGFGVASEVLGEIIVVVGEGVDACCECGGGAVDDVEGGLAGSGFVASELGDVDACGVCEGLLGQMTSDATYTIPAEAEADYYRQTQPAQEAVTQ